MMSPVEKICPVCGVLLKPRIVYEIEVDFCPKCGGVWLDGGELNKLMSKIKEYDRDYHSEPRYIEFEKEYKKRKKRKSIFEMLGEIFEAGD